MIHSTRGHTKRPEDVHGITDKVTVTRTVLACALAKKPVMDVYDQTT